MATEKQYEFFKYIYDEETVRHSRLVERGKIYLSVITFYLAVIAFKADSVFEQVKPDRYLLVLYLLVAVFSFLAFLLTITSLGIYRYEAITDLESIIKALGDSPPSDEQFLDERIIDLTVAYRRNSEQNQRRAKLLWLASLFMLGGVLTHTVFYFCFSLLR